MKITSTIISYINKHLIPMLIISFITVVVLVFFFIERSQKELANEMALKNAEKLSTVIREFRSLYTSEVINRLDDTSIKVLFNYDTIQHAIPLPVTLSTMLGKNVSVEEFGTNIKIYSPYPFPIRAWDSGLRDEFSRNAWAKFTENPDEVYYEYEIENSELFIRYATADIMRSECVNCHNTHPLTPFNEWKLGDLRGVLEVRLPVRYSTKEINDTMNQVYFLVSSLVCLSVFGISIFFWKLKKYEKRSIELLKSEKKANKLLEAELYKHILTEVELKESETRYRKMIDMSMDAIVVTDNEFNIFIWNQKAEIIFDWDSDEIIGHNFIETIISKQYRNEIREGLNAYLKNKKGNNIINRRIEVAGVTSENETFPMEIAITGLMSNDEIIFNIFIRDISERMLAEASLKESEQRYQLFTDMAIEGIMVSYSGKIHDINPSFTKIFGYELQDIENSSPLKIFKEPIPDDVLEYFNSDKSISVELEGVHKNGKVIPLLLDGRFFSYKSKNMRVSAFYDISEIKKAHEELIYRSKLEKLISKISSDFVNTPYHEIENSITNAIQSICELIHLDFGFMYLFNEAAEQSVMQTMWIKEGYKLDINKFEILEYNKFKWWYQQLVKYGVIHVEDVSSLPANGIGKELLLKEKITSMSVVSIFYQTKPIGFIGVGKIGGKRKWSEDDEGLLKLIGQVFINAIKRKTAEEALQESYSTLEKRVEERTAEIKEKNNQLKDFAYTVSHDLKAPLRGIVGYAQELTRKHAEDLNERGEFCLNQVITATRNLESLIEDLLSYSRLDTQQQNMAELNILELVQNILKDRESVIESYQTEIVLKVQDLTIIGWKLGLSQLLSNLIDNAIKYSREKSDPNVTIEIFEDTENLVCIISDNGIGFREKYKDRLFGLFNRLVRQDEFEGTGAGLAICKKVVDKYRGKITANSIYGDGATFRVELPKQSDITIKIK